MPGHRVQNVYEIYTPELFRHEVIKTRLFINTVLPSAPQARTDLGQRFPQITILLCFLLLTLPPWSSWYVVIFFSFSKVPLKSPLCLPPLVGLLSPCSWFWCCCDCWGTHNSRKETGPALWQWTLTCVHTHRHTLQVSAQMSTKVGRDRTDSGHCRCIGSDREPISNPHFHSESPVLGCNSDRTIMCTVQQPDLAQDGPSLYVPPPGT